MRIYVLVRMVLDAFAECFAGRLLLASMDAGLTLVEGGVRTYVLIHAGTDARAGCFAERVFLAAGPQLDTSSTARRIRRSCVRPGGPRSGGAPFQYIAVAAGWYGVEAGPAVFTTFLAGCVGLRCARAMQPRAGKA